MPITLYANAQNRFCFIFLVTADEIFIVFETSVKSFLIRIMSEVSAAISVPEATAIEMSAEARAGASFIPSPIMQTVCPLAFSLCITSLFSFGFTLLMTFSIPRACAIEFAVFSLSPVNI